MNAVAAENPQRRRRRSSLSPVRMGSRDKGVIYVTKQAGLNALIPIWGEGSHEREVTAMDRDNEWVEAPLPPINRSLVASRAERAERLDDILNYVGHLVEYWNSSPVLQRVPGGEYKI
jgi:hypothetical protein